MISKDVNNGSVGTDIHALSKSCSFTLTKLADSLNRSVEFISQIVRSLSSPSINDLRLISDFLVCRLVFLTIVQHHQSIEGIE